MSRRETAKSRTSTSKKITDVLESSRAGSAPNRTRPYFLRSRFARNVRGEAPEVISLLESSYEEGEVNVENADFGSLEHLSDENVESAYTPQPQERDTLHHNNA